MLLLVLGSVLPGSAAAVGTPPPSLPATSPVSPSASGQDDPASAEPMVIVDVLPSPRKARWFGKVGAGFAYRWALKESLLGGVVEGELGAQDHRLAGGVRVRVEAGRMLAGLPYQVVTLGPSLWMPALRERLRFGMGLEAGVLLLDRRSVPGTVMWTVLWGGRLDASVDLVRVGPSGGVFLAVQLAGQVLTAAPFPVSAITGVTLGYRP